MPDSTSSLDLGRGDVHEERLPGLGPVGYEWFVEVEQDGTVVAVDLVDGDPPAAGVAGVGPERRARVTGVGPGSATVVLTQRRRWEQRHLEQRRLEVRVT